MDKSRIVFYDENLEEVGSLPLNIAQAEQTWGDLPVVGSCVYVAPYGNFKDGQGHEVIQIDRDDLTISSFDVEEKVLNGAAASERCVYAFNDLNFVSTISRCDKETGEVRKTSIPEDHVTSALCADGSLWVFAQHEDPAGQGEEDYTGLLCRYDEDLNLIDTYDISACGSGQYRSLAHGRKLYFTSLAKARGSGPRRLGVFDMETGELSWIQLGKDYQNAMALVGDKLLVSHCDVIAGRNSASFLSVCDLASGEIEVRELEHDVVEMTLCGDRLYMLDTWQRMLFAYDAYTLEPEGSTEVSCMDGEYSYLANIFPMR